MANNVSPASENDFVGDNFTEFATLFGGSTAVDGFNNKDKLVLQPSSTLNKKPRGRPRGSKPKPKPTILRERNEFPKHIVFNVPAGMDIVNAIIDLGRNQDVTILVHSAWGFISQVNLFNRCSPSNDLSFRGNLYMLSLSGFYTKNISDSSFTIQFSRGWGLELFGGLVRHKLIAAKPVQVMATITKKHHHFSVVPSINIHPFPTPLAPYRNIPTK